MLNICKVLPDMYIMIAFMGKALAGARASSQDFFSLSMSVSAVVGGLRAGFLEEAGVRCGHGHSETWGCSMKGGCTLPLLASV